MYDCESCERRPALKVMLGHDAPPTTLYTKNLIDEKPLERCPLRTLQLADQSLVAEIHRHLNEYYPFYEDGHLLVDGGVSDQPARSMAYMLEIRRLKNVLDARFQKLSTGGDE